VRIVSLFLCHDSVPGKPTATPTTPFEANFLQDVARQLSADAVALIEDDPPIEALRSAIERVISTLKVVLLVVDDVDVLWHEPAEYLAFEEALSWLRGLGVKILITSRVPFHKSTLEAVCDVKPKEHRHLDIWWQCKLCLETEPEFFICDVCKEAGHGCPKRYVSHDSLLSLLLPSALTEKVSTETLI